MIKRTIYVISEMACCRDGQEAYHPMRKPIKAEVIADDFETSLPVWRDRAEAILNDKYRSMAEEECAGMGTLKLCVFNLNATFVDEEGEATLRKFIEEQREFREGEFERESEREPPIELYSHKGEKTRKKLKKQIAREIRERYKKIKEKVDKRTGLKRPEPIVKELMSSKEREDEYYEESERERDALREEAERSEVPEVIIQQLQILQNRIERTNDVDEYNSLRKEYDMLVQSYGLNE